VIILFL